MVKLKRTNKRKKVRIRGNQWVKGVRGHAAQFMTRSAAIKKLQVTLIQFRKLCILKGIYPRQPKKTPRGNEKTYYLKKDITFIMHDPIVKVMADRLAWKSKIIKAKNKQMPKEVASLKRNQPKFSLSHIVKERYPTFDDALQDLDDCLTLLFLFSMMPTSNHINPSRINNCKKLYTEFVYYIMKTHSLRKVFVSIKGIYYQAEIRSHTITWIVPFQYNLPKQERNVDYKVMGTFLHFYEVLLGFVNFKLYQFIGLSYPPNYTLIKQRKGAYLEALVPRTIGSTTEKQKQKTKKTKETPQVLSSKKRISSLRESLQNLDEEDDDEEQENSESEEKPEDKVVDEEVFQNDESILLRKEQEAYEGLFSEYHFWIGREVPRESLEFVIKSFGGRVSWDGHGKEEDEKITHHIMDRPRVDNKIVTRDYVQPQWVYDSINNRIVLPTNDYAPGKKLPAHLSPFVDDYSSGYVPEYRKKLDEIYEEKTGISRSHETATILEEDSESDDEEQKYAQDLESEKQGQYEENAEEAQKKGPNRKSAKFQQMKDEIQQLKTAESLLSHRKRRIVRSFRYKKANKARYIRKLESRQRLVKEGAAHVSGNTTLVLPY